MFGVWFKIFRLIRVESRQIKWALLIIAKVERHVLEVLPISLGV